MARLHVHAIQPQVSSRGSPSFHTELRDTSHEAIGVSDAPTEPSLAIRADPLLTPSSFLYYIVTAWGLDLYPLILPVADPLKAGS